MPSSESFVPDLRAAPPGTWCCPPEPNEQEFVPYRKEEDGTWTEVGEPSTPCDCGMCEDADWDTNNEYTGYSNEDVAYYMSRYGFTITNNESFDIINRLETYNA